MQKAGEERRKRAEQEPPPRDGAGVAAAHAARDPTWPGCEPPGETKDRERERARDRHYMCVCVFVYVYVREREGRRGRGEGEKRERGATRFSGAHVERDVAGKRGECGHVASLPVRYCFRDRREGGRCFPPLFFQFYEDSFTADTLHFRDEFDHSREHLFKSLQDCVGRRGGQSHTSDQ